MKIFNSNFRFLLAVFTLSILTTGLKADQNGKVITLREAIEIALKNNAGLKAAKADLKASGHNVKKARLDLFPKENINAAVGFAKHCAFFWFGHGVGSCVIPVGLGFDNDAFTAVIL